MTPALRKARTGALGAITGLITAATLIAAAQSYRGLHDWAQAHGQTGINAVTWPGLVDVFTMLGELTLFLAFADHWSARRRIFPWAITVLGLAASVAANMGHASPLLGDRLTAAVPPVAASAALTVGLGILKRMTAAPEPVIARTRRVSAPRPAPAPTVSAPEVTVTAPGPVATVSAAAATDAPATDAVTDDAPRTGKGVRVPDAELLRIASDLFGDTVPPLRTIQRTMSVGQATAQRAQRLMSGTA